MAKLIAQCGSVTVKVCNRCKEAKPLDAFHRASGAKDGRRGSCRICLLSDRRLRYASLNAENARRRRDDATFIQARRQSQRKYYYGISAAEWDDMFERQGRACAICRSASPGEKYDWATDHDHACCPGKRACGKCIRGILCPACNKGIGLLGDDPRRLTAAAAYLLPKDA